MTLGFDDAGRLHTANATNYGSHSYYFDTGGNNTGGSTSLSYAYDGFGQRITKTDSAQRFEQYGQDGKLLEVTDNLGGTARDYIYLNDRPVATFVPNGGTGTLSFLFGDRTGQPLAATSTAGVIGWSFAPDPFGAGTATAGSIANDLRFPGQEAEMTGFSHNGARNYVSGWGRYLEADPIGLNGGQNSLYAYAGNSPGRFVDPSGRDSATKENGPGFVYTNGGCYGLCASVSHNQAGNNYLNVGVGGVGLTNSNVYTNDMAALCNGLSLSGGVGVGGSVSFGAIAVGAESPGASLTYGIPFSTLQDVFNGTISSINSFSLSDALTSFSNTFDQVVGGAASSFSNQYLNSSDTSSDGTDLANLE